MPRRSAGLLLCGGEGEALRVFLVHPGGPFWARRDAGGWTLPKGEVEDGEDPLAVARREWEEETGQPFARCHDGRPLIDLGEVRQKGGKVVQAWAFPGAWPEGAEVASNTFTLEWPPRSGRLREFPEVDRGELFPLPEAREKILPSQVPFLDRLVTALAPGAGTWPEQ